MRQGACQRCALAGHTARCPRADLEGSHAEQCRPQQVVTGGSAGHGGRDGRVAPAIALPQLAQLRVRPRWRRARHGVRDRHGLSAWSGSTWRPGSSPACPPAGRAMRPGALPEGCTWAGVGGWVSGWGRAGQGMWGRLGLPSTRWALASWTVGARRPRAGAAAPSCAPDVGRVDQGQVRERSPARAPGAAAEHSQLHGVAPHDCGAAETQARAASQTANRRPALYVS